MPKGALQRTTYEHDTHYDSNSGRLEGGNNFPATRYFQIHFEHIEAMLSELMSRLIMLERQVEERQSSYQYGMSGSAPATESRTGSLATSRSCLKTRSSTPSVSILADSASPAPSARRRSSR